MEVDGMDVLRHWLAFDRAGTQKPHYVSDEEQARILAETWGYRVEGPFVLEAQNAGAVDASERLTVAVRDLLGLAAPTTPYATKIVADARDLLADLGGQSTSVASPSSRHSSETEPNTKDRDA